MRLETVWVVRDPDLSSALPDICRRMTADDIARMGAGHYTDRRDVLHLAIYTEAAEALADAESRLAARGIDPLVDIATQVSRGLALGSTSPWCVAGEVGPKRARVSIVDIVRDGDVYGVAMWLAKRLPPSVTVDIYMTRGETRVGMRVHWGRCEEISVEAGNAEI